MMQDGVTRAAFWDGSISRHLNPTPSTLTDANGERLTQVGLDETFIGLWMKWSGNRLWVSRDGMLFASDIGNPLKFTEAQYLNEGRAFYLPGECTGMIETPEQRVQDIVAQLRGIGSGRQQGFGKNRVMSMPDAVAQVLAEHAGFNAADTSLPGLPDEDESAQLSFSLKGDYCPGCGSATLLHIEGCKKCHECGYSEC
jgi:hypothetical protein